jgi:hypothetical protein
MKKFFLILMAVALVGSFAFAEVTGVDAPTLTGDVTTTFGYDLDNEGVGFKNESNVSVTVPLAAGSDTHAGSGGIYAEITIEDIDISFDTDSDDWDEGAEVSYDADISAKIVAGALWVGLGNPDMDFNNVDLDRDVQTDADDGDVDVDVNAAMGGEDGIEIGYATDAFSFAFQVASKYDAYEEDSALVAAEDDSTSWIDSNETDDINDGALVANDGPDFVFGVQASVTAGPATIPVSFAFDAEDEVVAVGAAPSIAAGAFTLDIPVDYVKVADEYGFEMQPALGYEVAGVGTFTADFLFASYDIDATADAEAGVDVTVVEQIMELGVVYEAGFMDALSLTVDFDLTGLDADSDIGWNVNFDTKYDMGTVAPYLTVDYGDNEDLDLSVGADLAVIDNATVTLDYTNGHVLDGATADSAEKGVITLAVAVEY